MRTYAVREDLFAVDPVSTERQMYEQLIAHPPTAEVNYLAVPWALVINRGELDDLTLPQLNGGFTICQHVSFQKLVPLLAAAGIDTLFTPHASNASDIGDLRVRAIPHASVNGTEPAAEKDLLYSFIGFDSTTAIRNPLRSALFEMSHPQQTVVRRRSCWHWADQSGDHVSPTHRQLEEAAEYRGVLARSRFSICPRGHGPGTIRFWESLQAQAIPVLLSDDWLLPDGVDWEQCVVRLPENRVRDIPEVVRAIAPEQEKAMRAACGRAFALNAGANLARAIRSDQTLRIYSMVTPSHRQMFDRWFLPTLSEPCEVRILNSRQLCPSGEYETEGWRRTVLLKVEGILRAIEENWGGIFLYADVDVQFFAPIGSTVRAALRNNDMVFQRDGPDGTLCAGYFGARANSRTRDLWREIRTRLRLALQDGTEETALNDQTELNKILRDGDGLILGRFGARLSQALSEVGDRHKVPGSMGVRNKYGVRWSEFPSDVAYTTGVSTGRQWQLGDAVSPPLGIKVHHANWTVGVENKLSLLRAVRDRITGTDTPPPTARDDVEVTRFEMAG